MNKVLKELELNAESIAYSKNFDLLSKIWYIHDTPKNRKIVNFIRTYSGAKTQEHGSTMGECGPNREAVAYLGDIKVKIFWANNKEKFFTVSFNLINGRVHPKAALVGAR